MACGGMGLPNPGPGDGCITIYVYIYIHTHYFSLFYHMQATNSIPLSNVLLLSQSFHNHNPLIVLNISLVFELKIPPILMHTRQYSTTSSGKNKKIKNSSLTHTTNVKLLAFITVTTNLPHEPCSESSAIAAEVNIVLLSFFNFFFLISWFYFCVSHIWILYMIFCSFY